jgi:hypothetical protein
MAYKNWWLDWARITRRTNERRIVDYLIACHTPTTAQVRKIIDELAKLDRLLRVDDVHITTCDVDVIVQETLYPRS